MKNTKIYWGIFLAAVALLVLAVSCGASAAGKAAEAHKPGKDLHDVYEYVKEVHGYANGNSYYIKVLNEKKLSKEEFQKDQARQDKVIAGKVDTKTFETDQDRQDKATRKAQDDASAAGKGVAHNAKAIDRNSAAISATDKIVTRHTGEIGALQGRATQADLDIASTQAVNTAQGKTLVNHGNRLDGHDAQFASQADLNAALNTRLGGAYERIDNHESRISKLERNQDRNNEAAAIGLAIAGHQFDTKGGFQTAVSVSTVAGREALAIGMGGAISERVFINAGVATSGNTTGGVVSSTFSW